MADTRIKKRFGDAEISYEPFSWGVILEIAGQFLHLSKKEFEATRLAFDWVAQEERDRYSK